jgi:hypothetical protein
LFDLSKNNVEVITRLRSLSRRETWQLKAHLSTWLVPLALAAFWMLVVLIIHRNSPRTLMSFHGLLHAAIAGKFLPPGSGFSLPENPFFAGEPVAYYWFFHYLAAQITKTFGLNLSHSLELLVVLATGVLMVTAVRLGTRLSESKLSGVLIGYFIMAGTNPLGWLFAAKSVLRNGTSVLQDDPEYLWGVVHPIYSLVRYNDFGGLYGPLVNFFLNITSRPLSLATLLVSIYILFLLFERRRFSLVLALAAASTLTTAFSPVIGITTGGSLVAALLVVYLRTRDDGFDGRISPARCALYAGLAIPLGIIVALPTYYHLVLNSGGGNAQFILFSAAGLSQSLGIAMSISVLLGLAILGLYRARSENRRFLTALILSALLLLVVNASFVLMAGNQSNLFHAAVILLAVPASASVFKQNRLTLRPVVDRRLLFATVAVFLPTTLVVLSSYINRPALPISFDSAEVTRTPENSDLANMYAWARKETAPNAVFIVDPQNRVAACGNTAEFPALSSRTMFTEDSDHYLTKPYADAGARVDIAHRLASGAEPTESDKNYLSKLNRPIYILNYQSDDGYLERMQKTYSTPVFQAGRVTVFQLSPQFTSGVEDPTLHRRLDLPFDVHGSITCQVQRPHRCPRV